MAKKHLSAQTGLFRLSILFSLLAANWSTAAATDPLADAEPTEQGSEFNYEVITVTSQRRAQDLSEVPIALSSFSADNIQQTGIQQLREISDFIPNMEFSRGTDFGSQVTIRGVGANSRNVGFDTRVGVYLDGVYLGQSPALNQALYDLERVEVLRGPQGTLFGKNTVAGAVNMISARPIDFFEGKASVMIGNMNAREVQGRVNIPLSADSAVKVSANRSTRDGYIDNLTTGSKLNERDSTAFRIQFLSELSNDLELYMSVDGLRSHRLSFLGEALTNSFGTALNTEAPDKFQVATTTDTYEERDLFGAHLELSYQFGEGYAVKSISAYRDSDSEYRNDSDYSTLDIFSIVYADHYRQWSQEFQFISPEHEQFNYIVGLYLYRQNADSVRDGINGPVSAMFGNQPGSVVTNFGEVKTTSYALFANSAYQLSDRMNLAVGLRFTDETKEVDWLLDGRASGIFGIGFTEDPLNQKRSDQDLSYSVSLNAQLSSHINSYLKYSTAFKSGGYNLDYVTNADLEASLEFDKERVGSIELGLKGAFLQHRLMANFALFRANFSDYQVNQLMELPNGGTSFSIRNASEVTSQGMELEITYRPISSLQIQASLGLLDATFDDFPNALAGNMNAAGNQLPDAPKRNASLSGQYVTELNRWNTDLLLRADITHKGSYYTTVTNQRTHTLLDGTTVPYGYIEENTMLNVRAGLLTHSGWEAYIWARNLTNSSKAIHSSRDFFGTITANYQEPRTFGLELVYNF
ncbi:MAG: TonB-dependent receptor [Alkalimonas sp.]|nr:TonB-dependent receptor [Alkalimonas sp.]